MSMRKERKVGFNNVPMFTFNGTILLVGVRTRDYDLFQVFEEVC
jgi:hypothetical protein